MNEREFLGLVRSLPVFTTRQVASLVGGSRYAKVYLHRLMARGVVRRIGRSFYTIHEDPVVYATHIYYPSYISLWQAFQHHGVTTQLPAVIEVMAPRSGVLGSVEFIRSRHLWGYSAARYGDFGIFMADLEKAVLDALSTGRVPPDVAAGAIGKCDPGKLEKYALRMDIGTIKKVGYIAETGGLALERLHRRINKDRNYVRLAGARAPNRWRVKSD